MLLPTATTLTACSWLKRRACRQTASPRGRKSCSQSDVVGSVDRTPFLKGWR